MCSEVARLLPPQFLRKVNTMLSWNFVCFTNRAALQSTLGRKYILFRSLFHLHPNRTNSYAYLLRLERLTLCRCVDE